MKWDQLRLNFSDYSAAEQEADAEHRRMLKEKYRPHAFFLKVDGVWAHIAFPGGKEPDYRFYEGKTLIESYYKLREDHPYHKVKYIMNKGIEDYLRTKKKQELSVNKLQRMIDFNNGYNL